MLLFLWFIRGLEKLLCSLEKFYNILNNDRDRREGKGQAEVKNCFTDPKIEYRQSYADPNRIAPFTCNQFVKT